VSKGVLGFVFHFIRTVLTSLRDYIIFLSVDFQYLDQDTSKEIIPSWSNILARLSPFRKRKKKYSMKERDAKKCRLNRKVEDMKQN